MYTIRYWDCRTTIFECAIANTHKEAEGALKMLMGQKQPRIVVIKGENVARFTLNGGRYDRVVTTSQKGDPFHEMITCPHDYDLMGECVFCGSLKGETESLTFLG